MSYTVLGTDGFGRSDTRANLRRFFGVDRYYIAHAAIAALAKDGKMTGKTWPGRSSCTRSIRRRRTRLGFEATKAKTRKGGLVAASSYE